MNLRYFAFSGFRKPKKSLKHTKNSTFKGFSPL